MSRFMLIQNAIIATETKKCVVRKSTFRFHFNERIFRRFEFTNLQAAHWIEMQLSSVHRWMIEICKFFYDEQHVDFNLTR